MNFSSDLCTADADVDTDAWDVHSDIESSSPRIADVPRHSESMGPSLVPKSSRTAARGKNDPCTDSGYVSDANTAVNFATAGEVTAATKVRNSEKTIEHTANGG